jgi:polysaccharide biosynthesis protein PelG
MAGIGFRLEKLLQGGTSIGAISAHFYSAMIVAGPWLLTTLTIFLLNYFRPSSLSAYDILYFRTAITYTFVYSLIFTGLVSMSLARYLADRLYAQEHHLIVATFNSTILLVLVLQTLSGALFYFFAGGDPLSKVLIVLIYLTVSMIWVTSAFLSALRDFVAVGRAFLIGGLVAFVACYLLGRRFGLTGYFVGYLLGYLGLLSLLAIRVLVEFQSNEVMDGSAFRILQIWPLALAGFFFMAGTWIDKLVVWWSPLSRPLTNFFRISPDYDSAAFFAMLTLIPSLSHFLIYVETDFYRRYKTYFQTVLGRGSLRAVLLAKEEISGSLRGSVWTLVRNQSVFTIATVILAPQIVSWLDLRDPVIPILRVMALGAMCHGLFLVTMTLIAYFDYIRICCGLGLLFLVTNGLFTLATVCYFPDYLGYGYFLSTMVCLAIAYFCLNWGLKELEFYTFTEQAAVPDRE